MNPQPKKGFPVLETYNKPWVGSPETGLAYRATNSLVSVRIRSLSVVYDFLLAESLILHLFGFVFSIVNHHIQHNFHNQICSKGVMLSNNPGAGLSSPASPLPSSPPTPYSYLPPLSLPLQPSQLALIDSILI